MKKIAIVAIAVIICFTMCCCGKEPKTLDNRNYEKLEYTIQNFSLLEIFEEYEKEYGESVFDYIFYEYGIEGIIELYAEECGSDFFETQDYLLDVENVFVHMSDYDREDYYGTLIQMANDIGMYPSEIVGRYCFDQENKVIHSPNHWHINNIDYKDMCFEYRYLSMRELKEIMEIEGSWVLVTSKPLISVV